MAMVVAIVWMMLFLSCRGHGLRFDGRKGEFKILQVADMHYANGRTTACRNVLPQQVATCSDLNTTAFLRRLILAEKPDLIVFTGDNIYDDATNATASLNAAFAPAISSGIPWAAVLGNHDQASTLSREGVMRHIVTMNNTLSRLNPSEPRNIDGYGNYNLEVYGAEGSSFANKSVLNLYLLDSGDYTKVTGLNGPYNYDWIKPSQLLWFQQTSSNLQRSYMSDPQPHEGPAPGLVYFHIPLPEFADVDSRNMTGEKLEPYGNGISSASVNSGFFAAMKDARDVKALFTGHDHLNDFCGKLMDINLCYAGGFGYHAYGRAGWARRARVVVASLEKTSNGTLGAVESIRTWKRLDDASLSTIDSEVLWNKIFNV